MKPSQQSIEAKRREIIQQAFDDQRAPLGRPYYHVQLFEAYIMKVYEEGVKDGQEGVLPR